MCICLLVIFGIIGQNLGVGNIRLLGVLLWFLFSLWKGSGLFVLLNWFVINIKWFNLCVRRYLFVFVFVIIISGKEL